MIFSVLHGTYGEDGQLQSDLDQLGIPYVGSGAVASELAMDKSDAKSLFAKAGIAIAPGVTVTEAEWRREPSAVTKIISNLGMPLFVKGFSWWLKSRDRKGQRDWRIYFCNGRSALIRFQSID